MARHVIECGTLQSEAVCDSSGLEYRNYKDIEGCDYSDIKLSREVMACILAPRINGDSSSD